MNLSLCVYLLQPLYFPTRYGELIPCADSTGQSEPLRSKQTWSFSSTVTVATLLHLVQKQALLSDDLFWYYFQLDAAVHNTLDSLNSAAAFFLIIFFFKHNPVFKIFKCLTASKHLQVQVTSIGKQETRQLSNLPFLR